MQNNLVQNYYGMFGGLGSHQKGQPNVFGQTGSGKSAGGGLNPALVSAWPMTEGSGTAFNDATANHNTETISQGSLVWASNAGFSGTTATFSATAGANGSNDTGTNFDGTAPFSISTWVKLAGSAGEFRTFVSNLGASGAFTGYELLDQPQSGTDRLCFYVISNFTGSDYMFRYTNAVLAVGTLYNLVVTYDGSKATAGIQFYINGVVDTGVPSGHDAVSGSTASGVNVSLGQRASGGGNPIDGIQAYTGIYNTVLTPTQVAANYAKGPGIY